jgi:hypothetical protein
LPSPGKRHNLRLPRELPPSGNILLPLQSIIVVFLRLLALQWVLQSMVLQLSTLLRHFDWIYIIWFAGTLLLAFLFWNFSEQISRWVTRNHEVTVPFGGLTRQDLYAFTFVYLGLSFFISGIGTFVNLIAIFANIVGLPTDFHKTLSTESGVLIVKNSVQTILGLIALFNANRFAKKLASRDS